MQSRSELGPFTFSASLYSNGNVVFAYYSLPIEIEKIEDDKHPVKVGVSDAYIIDKTIYRECVMFFLKFLYKFFIEF